MRAGVAVLALVALLLAAVTAPVDVSADDYVYPGLSNRPSADASFCDRLAYSNGYNWTTAEGAHATLMEFIRRAYNGVEKNATFLPPVISSVQGLLQNPLTSRYFDASIDYRSNPRSPYHNTSTPNYRTTPSEAYQLDLKLAAWFGRPEGWKCSGLHSVTRESFAATYPYASIGSTQMGDVHAGMAITDNVFAAFINQFSDAALSMSATPYDFQTNVVPYLQSFARGAPPQDSICVASGCSCATGLEGTNCDVRTADGEKIVPGAGPQEPNISSDAPATSEAASLLVSALATLAAFFALRQ